MNISINRVLKDGPFGGGNAFLRMFRDYMISNGHSVFSSLCSNTDVILIIENKDELASFGYGDIKLFRERNKNVKVIQRVNENDARKKTCYMDDTIIKNSKIADALVFVSKYLMDYFCDSRTIIENKCVIWNGCDRKLYFPLLKTRNKNEPINIVTHHWSDNINKGFDTYRNIDEYCRSSDRFKFHYIGRFPAGYIKYGTIISPQAYDKIPYFLKKCDIYVSASKWEPGANHIMEGLSCGLIPIVSNDSGSCIEYISGYGHVFGNIDEFISIINNLYNDYDYFLKSKQIANGFTYSSNDMCEKYLSLINNLL